MPIPVFAKPRHGPPATCAFCRRVLQDTDDAEAEICGRPECQTRKRVHESTALARENTRIYALWLKRTKRRTRGVIKKAAADIGQPDLRNIAYGLAPHIDMPMEALPPDRRAAFEAHLRSVIAESFDTSPEPPAPPDADPDYTHRRAEEVPDPFVINASCIACQGSCCMQGGGSHAFLTKETIAYTRWRRPDLSQDEIFQTYLSYFPERSTLGSCVYHGEQGCTLERQLRANICNSFQCSFRRSLMAEHARKPQNGAVVAGISRDHTDDPSAGAPYLRVVSVSANNEVRVHTELSLPQLRKDRETP